MDDINYLLLLSRWLHVGAAIVAIGGAAFVRSVLQPAAQESLEDTQHDRLREAVRKRWSKFVFICIALLFVTGAINFVILAMPPKIAAMPYHPIFGIKLIAAFGVFFIGSALAGRSAGLAGMRQKSRKWLGVMLALAALIVLLSGLLGQVRSGSKPPSESATLTSS